MASTVDERGRILLPRDLRTMYGLTPGSPVIIESEPDGVKLKPALEKGAALDRLAGAIHAGTRKRGAKRIDPLTIKKIWEPSP